MMTAIADPPPLSADVPQAVASAGLVPVATLAVDLMPDEIRVRRRLGYLKRRLVFVVAALVALIVLGDLLVRQQTSSAESELAAANDHISGLTGQLRQFSSVLTIKGETQTIWTQLDGVMGTDVSWPSLLGDLAEPAPSGLHLTSISAQLNDPDSAAGSTGAGVPAATPLSADAAGTVTLSGTAPSWQAVATYVRGLSAIRGFTAVNPSTVSNAAGGGKPTFTITLDLTSAVLSDRYSTTGAAPGSGTTGSTGPAAAVIAGSSTAAGAHGSSTGSTAATRTSAHGTSGSTSSTHTQHGNRGGSGSGGGTAQSIQETN